MAAKKSGQRRGTKKPASRKRRKGRGSKPKVDELGELVDIARALTQERDIDRLLDLILQKSRFITGADAGSIYVLEGEEHAPSDRTLRFKLSQNDSCEFESSEFTIPVSMRSIAGAAVLSREPIRIDDVYELDEETPYGFDRSFDARFGYRTRSLLTLPLISAEERAIGAIQLINKKRDASARLYDANDIAEHVVPFDAHSLRMASTLAAQAGIALENALLYDEITRIFDGFVHASVEAIEQRDPSTSGHSLRVSVLSCALAEHVDRLDAGPYANVRFSRPDMRELRYAALLHDFGKIGVREQVLVKAKKLYHHQLESIRARFDYAFKAIEAETLAHKLELVQAGASRSDLRVLDDAAMRRYDELSQAWELIQQANEPTVLSKGDFSRIAELTRLEYLDTRGRPHPFLTQDEAYALRVRRGSLVPDELEEIRSHVVHTRNFLSRIPWGRSFRRIPEIAGAHHERLDGSGYPEGLESGQIPLASKIMTVVDIYDALTARDRPYKKALPRERALEILDLEIEEGHIDAELVRVFREAEVFREVEGDSRVASSPSPIPPHPSQRPQVAVGENEPPSSKST